MQKHLAIFSKEAAKQIFLGHKNFDAWFSQKKIAPFGEVEAGDLVYIKPKGGEPKGQFLVKKVIFFDNLDEKDWQLLKMHYQIEEKKLAKFGTLIFMDRVEQFLTSPIKIAKKDQRAWLILE